ncbi:MAG: hypothetical protein SFV51_27885 [Bryobacteraceae bacterium]|nr:hypothetical protein [Bryobacteraceae bacterium]
MPPVTAQPQPKLRFVPVSPCRVKDTRIPDIIITPLAAISGGSARAFPIAGHCGVPASAKAFSLNITAVPLEPVSYITIWPTGEQQPFTSLLNSWDGRVVAAATIVKAGTNGNVSIYTTHQSHIIIDINGYFVESTSEADLVFYPLTPCRVIDSRLIHNPLGPPPFAGGQSRTVNMAASGCGIPTTARAFSLNFTIVAPPGGVLGYLTAFPTGITRPIVSTLNALNGGVVANAAIVPAGTNSSIDVYVTDTVDVIIDINGYFAPPAPNGLSFYMLNNCRVADTRPGQGTTGTLGPPTLSGGQSRTLNIPSGNCGVPLAASAAYVLNATVVPHEPLGYLTLWPTGLAAQPFVSTLNSFGGLVVSNMAIVPAGTGGAINAFVTNPTELVLDISGYFAP